MAIQMFQDQAQGSLFGFGFCNSLTQGQSTLAAASVMSVFPGWVPPTSTISAAFATTASNNGLLNRLFALKDQGLFFEQVAQLLLCDDISL